MDDRYKYRFAINNKVFDVYKIDLINNSVEFNQNGFVSISELDKGELLTCIGLKDKNSKLIFEGDILKDDAWVGFVNMEDGCCQINYAENLGSELLCNLELKNQIIIGNKYENPELLKR